MNGKEYTFTWEMGPGQQQTVEARCALSRLDLGIMRVGSRKCRIQDLGPGGLAWGSLPTWDPLGDLMS